MEKLVRPFLKWAGGKQRILHHLRANLPQGKRLIEPFLGSGAVSLNLNYPHYLLADSNPELINLYLHLQREGLVFINYCKRLFTEVNNDKAKYYELRSKFNATRSARLKAALFLYLNRHCYNGLCRFNNSGKFNVPFGQYKKVLFPEQALLNFCLKAQRITFAIDDFGITMNKAKMGDVVYCDPPYVPLSKTANFTQYSMQNFDEYAQICLAEEAEKLAHKGITVVISNNNTDFTRELYQKAEIKIFNVPRLISCKGAGRTQASELLAIYNNK